MSAASRTSRSWMGHPLTQVAFGLLVYIVAVFDLVLLNASIRRLQGNDFGKFYYAFHAWRVGWSLYVPTSATHMEAGDEYAEFLNLNPPHFHLLLWPFAGWPLQTAAYAWMAVNVLLGLVAVGLVIRDVGLKWRRRWLLPCLAAALACSATGAIALTGQFTGMLLVALALAWRALRRRQEWRAGVWLGLLISVKPFLGLFGPVLLVRREWRAAVAAGVAGAACFAVGLAMFGLQAHQEWIRALGGVQWAWAAMNGSWRGLLARVLSPSPYAVPLANLPSLIGPLWLVGAIVVGLLTMQVSRRSVDHAFGAVVLGALLISPLGWVYYLWLALPGLVGVWRNGVPWTARLGLVGLLVPYFGPMLGQLGPWATLTIGSVYTWATLALWVALLRSPMLSEEAQTRLP